MGIGEGRIERVKREAGRRPQGRGRDVDGVIEDALARGWSEVGTVGISEGRIDGENFFAAEPPWERQRLRFDCISR